MSASLKDLIIIDLGQIYNGSYCSLMLAYQGAKVIKIEPLQGEILRGRSSTDVDPYEFMMLNSNKSSIAIDLKSLEGRDLIYKLVEIADVVVENFSTGVMERLGLSYEKLKAINPRIIVGSGKGYGSEGPYANFPAMDLTIQAISGALSTTGYPDAPPVKSGVAFADFMGGIHLYAGIVTALYHREKMGEGQHVEVSMHDTIYPTLASPLSAYYNYEGAIPERTGNRHSGLAYAPYNVYPAKDGYIAIFCVTDKHWRSLLSCIGNPSLMDVERLSTNKQRTKNMAYLDEKIGGWTKSYYKKELAQKLLEYKVPNAPVMTIEEVEDDPHLKQRGMIREITHPVAGDIKVPGSPISLSRSPLEKVTPAPLLGEHTDVVLGELIKLNRKEIDKLRERGVIK